MNLKSKIKEYTDERMREMKKKRISKIEKMLEIPEEVYSNTPKIIITGFDQMIIENFKSILEYEEFYIRISTYIGVININGYNLNLENMTNDDLKVTGKIDSFDIERISDD